MASVNDELAYMQRNKHANETCTYHEIKNYQKLGGNSICSNIPIINPVKTMIY